MERSTRSCVSLFDQEVQDFTRDLRIVDKTIKEVETSSGNEKNEINLREPVKDRTNRKGGLFGCNSEAIEKTGMTCSICLVVFESVESQRQHFKLDWHRFNLKQKLMDKPILSEDAFEETISGEVSSISGSDSDDDLALESNPISSPSINGLSMETTDDKSGPTGRHHPKLVFVNGSGDLLSVYRSVLYSVKDIPSTPESLLSLFTDLPTKRYWMVLMTAGGHFAGAVFNGKEVVIHKTFHRYTVRAKRGTAQGIRDGQQGGKHPKSAGASLRRYNETALVQDVQDLLEAWSQHLERCDRIFLRAPVYNKSIFFGGKKPPFNKDDARVRTIPFPTRRPTFNEVKRVHQELSSVQLLGKESELTLHDLPKEISKPKTGDLPSSEDDKGRLWHDKNALETTGLEVEDKNTLEEMDITLRETNSAEEMGNLALTTKQHEISKKINKRKKTKGKKVEVADLLHNGEKLSSKQHLWNRLYCVIVSGNNQVISSLLGATISGSQTGESLHQENEKQTMNDGLSSLALSGKTAANTIPSEKCLCVESGTRASPSCENHHSKIKLTNSESSCHRTSPIEGNEISGNEETGQITFDLKLANGCEGCEEEETNCDAFGETCHGNEKEVLGEDDSKRVEISQVLNERFGEGNDTLLHVASRSSRTDVVAMLLGIGADPAVKDGKGRPPYVVAGSKETRNEFRRFMASFPDRYDYVKAQIPSPLTPEMQSEKDRKNAEKKKAQKKAQKQRNKEQKTVQRKKEEEEKEKLAFQSLSEREKRAVAAERRFAQQQAAKAGNTLCCAWCSTSLSGQVPFERLSYQYCSTACVKAHRLDMAAHQR